MHLRAAVPSGPLLFTLIAALTTGCQFYWSKTGGTADQFNPDSPECAKESSPSPQAAKYGIGTEEIYKVCMTQRGRGRENTVAGKFRGIEDWD